jgi:hypothetical protein
MRTTLTLDDDVAALLRHLQQRRKSSLKEVVNEALRCGLRELDQPPRPRKRVRFKTFDVGRCLIDNVDCVSEALAVAEGEDFK